MRIAILSRNRNLYSTRRLVDAAEKRGHDVLLLDHMKCVLVIEQGRPHIYFNGREVKDIHAVIPRIGASATFYGSAVVRQFEMMKIFTAVESQALTRSRDKLRSLQILARAGIGIPKTGFASSPKDRDIDNVIESIGGAPCVVKLLEGTQGIGVILADNQKAAKSVIEAFLKLEANMLVQEFIAEAGGADLRVFVVDGQVVGAMKRQAKEGEFRSNLHRGGSAKVIHLTTEERATAIKAAKKLGLGIAGVDLLQSSRGPLVMEVNSSPGLEGIEGATGIDIAGKIIEYVERNEFSKPGRIGVQETITINGQSVEPGETKTVILNSYELHTKTRLEIPVHVINSKEAGPRLLLSAGMHGEETNGIEIIRKVISRQEVQALKCGALIAIPVINVISFLYGSRDLPDGRDLNRCFPGSKKGSIGSRIAFDLMNHILPVIDFGVDFHTGGARINNYPQIRCVFDFPENLELAERFSAPLIIDSTYREGTFRKEAAKKDKPILVFEGGESMRFDYLAINEGVNGCLRLMNSYKMIDFELPGNASVKLADDTWVRAHNSGLFHMNLSNGAHVLKGDLMGVIMDPFGETVDQIISPIDGYIVGINNQPVVNMGDALIHIGAEHP